MQYIPIATSFCFTPCWILHLLSPLDPLLFCLSSEKSTRLASIKPESLTLTRWTIIYAQADAILEGKKKKDA